MRRFLIFVVVLPILLAVVGSRGSLAGGVPVLEPPKPPAGFEFIDTGFENASPLWYEIAGDGTIGVHVNYDHERNSPNRAAGHYHFRIHAATGSRLTLEFKNLDNIYNGRPGSLAGEMKTAFVSENGREWKPLPTRALPGNRVLLDLQMTAPALYVARLEPYRISDLDRFLASIRKHPRVQIERIGKTVEGRDLEIIRVGSPRAPYRAFLRARAHPWEPGGNWVVQGLVRRLLRDDPEAKAFLEGYCVYILPMANKDGVAHGRSRFNLRGRDLNRQWDQPSDAELAPENHALESWLQRMIRAGQRPHLALELHNDGSGRLHYANPPVANLARYIRRLETLEGLLRKHTWFTEGASRPTARGASTLGDGWLLRFGIDAAVHEFNCQWVAGLKDYPSGRHWEEYGAGLCRVFHDYFDTIRP